MRSLEDLAQEDLAQAIDAASNAGDETSLRRLGDECERRLNAAEVIDRVDLLYYQSNTYAGIVSLKHDAATDVWDWKQSDGVNNLLCLRRAISEPSFGSNPARACQIRTNLANRLKSLGRPIAANEQWLKALEIEPQFAKALTNRAKGMAFFASMVYDPDHTVMLLAAARASFDAALDECAVWDSGDRDSIAPGLIQERERVARSLTEEGYDEHFEHFDTTQQSLGSTDEERSYRRWCLGERLFLNPLNEAYTESVAANDVLHLPSHTYRADEPARFPSYFNLLKQEYVSARYRLYRAVHQDDPDFVMRDVLMLGGDGSQVLGHCTEDLRSAFRSAYSIFDKIGLFLNDYFRIGLKPREVNFRQIWVEKPKGSDVNLRPMFEDRPNLPLRGLYFLSKDLFDPDLVEVAEPDADDLDRLRNQIEHRFLSLQRGQEMSSKEIYRRNQIEHRFLSLQLLPEMVSNETHQWITIDELQGRALRLLKMAREALVYLSLAMHREETLRQQDCDDDGRLVLSLESRPIDVFKRLGIFE